MFGIANRLAKIPAARKIIGHARMMDRESLHDFWRQPAPEGNIPADYVAEEATNRSEALLGLISDLPKDARILEVGCNAGRNLAYLFNAGYKNVEGIEISPHAVQLLRDTYPELKDVPVHIGAAEDVLPTYADKSFDLVFTMAVLEHIHPDSREMFGHIERIAKRIVAIEPTTHHISSRQFPHDMRKLFAGFESEEPVEVLPTYSAFSFKP